MPSGVALIAALTLLDAFWRETLASTVVLAPFIVSLSGSPRETIAVGALAVLSAALSPLWNHNFDSVDYFIRLGVVVVGSVFALAGARGRARLARERLGFRMLSAVSEMSERSAGIDETLEKLSDILVPAVADVCVIDLLRDERVDRLAVAAHGPRSDEIKAALCARAPRGATTPNRGETLIRDYHDEALREAALDDDDLDFLRSSDARSAITVPMKARRRRIGTLALAVTSLSGRDYDEQDLAFARVLSGRVALALDNAGLFTEVETLAARQAAALGSLAEAVTMQDRDGAVVYANEAAARALGYASPEELLATSTAELAEAFDSYLEDGSPLDFADLPGRRVLAGENPEPLVLRSVSRRTGEERWRVTKATGVRDAAGRVRLAVNVIEDVTEVKRAEHAQRLLAETGHVLASSLDYEETLARVAQLAIGELADWCGVTLPGERGTLRSVAVAHVDPDKVRFARELNERYPQRLDEPGGAADVIRSGTSQVVNEITDELLEQSVRDPEQLEAIRELGMHAAMIVPMVAGGRAIGAISFVAAESRRSFSDADRELAEELGRRAGTAVENARLYTERSRIADTLQASLLPAGLPAIPGFSLASLYRPAGEENWVGGDFYDAFRTTAGWMVVVGDVAGRGAAAAALTGQARHTLRTAAQLLGDPLAALAQLNRSLAELPDTALCTVAALHLVETDGAVEATVVCAGHPKPYLVRDSDPVPIGNWGPMVGAFADSVWLPETLTLEPGDVIVLYTDGVIDADGDDERFGDARLTEALRGTADASDAVGRIRRALEAFETGAQADDTAVLAVAFTGDRARAGLSGS
ncbi:MAG: SpoIIE family protein phosphatase [Actinomycetota bacterium]|nr:SpoIIE family protein phosphatase [Actinomycetota bacterium]